MAGFEVSTEALQAGDGAHVLGRTTRGTGDAPEIKVLLDGGSATFSNGVFAAVRVACGGFEVRHRSGGGLGVRIPAIVIA